MAEAVTFRPAHINLGSIEYLVARKYQEERVAACLEGGNECLITCEHPVVVTVGRRTSAIEEESLTKVFGGMNVPVVRVQRGGIATLHLPGQLVIYPVISLRRRKLSAKRFVELGLESLAEVCGNLGIVAKGTLDRPGVWVGNGERKVASVGLEICRGVTNHGFALNYSCELSLFRIFRPCGFDGQLVSSLSQEGAVSSDCSISDLAEAVYASFLSALS